MKRIAIAVLVLVAAPTFARDWKPLETNDEARQRRSTENYDTYRERRSQPPLGGYNDRLGDPIQAGTERPGYIRPPQERDDPFSPSRGYNRSIFDK